MENTEENNVQEPRKSTRVEAHNKKDKARFFDEDQIYCSLDNHKCDGPCRKRNTEKHGTLICSEVISSADLPKKKKKKKFFSRREDRDDEHFVG